MTEYEAWLQSLKVGYEVSANGRHGSYGRQNDIGKVTRSTKTQIDAFNNTYDRATGYSRGTSAWGHSYLMPITAEIRAEVAWRKAFDMFRRIDPTVLSTSQLERIIEIAREQQS